MVEEFHFRRLLGSIRRLFEEYRRDSGNKEKSKYLKNTLEFCIDYLCTDNRYYDDIRLLKLHLIYVDVSQDFKGVMEKMQRLGIGQGHALFYEAFAFFKILKEDDLKGAYDLLTTGIRRKAEPLDRLKKYFEVFMKNLARIHKKNGDPDHQVDWARFSSRPTMNDDPLNNGETCTMNEGQLDNGETCAKVMTMNEEPLDNREKGADEMNPNGDPTSKTAEERLEGFQQNCLAYMRSQVHNTIKCPLEDNMYCTGRLDAIHIEENDIKNFCSQDWLSSTMIKCFCSMLYSFCEVYKFVDISNMLFDPVAMYMHVGNIIRRMPDTNIVLLVYNPGGHWVLVVIELVDWTVIYMDPLGNEAKPDFKSWMQSVFEVVTQSPEGICDDNAPTKTTPRNITEISWKVGKAKRQKGGSECGYYVMVYLWKLIQTPPGRVMDLPFVTEFSRCETEEDTHYTQDEIDEVRLFLADHMTVEMGLNRV